MKGNLAGKEMQEAAMLIQRSDNPLVRFIDGWQAKALLCIISAALLLAVDLCPCGISQVFLGIGLNATLHGTVTDVNGKPLAGVAVNYKNLDREDLEGRADY